MFFAGNGLQSVFMNTLITKGVFRWTVKLEFSGYGHPEFHIDGVHGRDLSYYDKHALVGYDSGIINRFGFELHEGFDNHKQRRRTCVFVRGTDSKNMKPDYTDISQYSRVTVEVNVNLRQMFLLINNNVFPRAISNISIPFNLGISSPNNNSFTSLSFERLPSNTQPPTGCVFDQCL